MALRSVPSGRRVGAMMRSPSLGMESRRRWSPPPPSLEVAMAGEACGIRMRWGGEEVEGRGDGGHRMGLGKSRCRSKDRSASRVASDAGTPGVGRRS